MLFCSFFCLFICSIYFLIAALKTFSCIGKFKQISKDDKHECAKIANAIKKSMKYFHMNCDYKKINFALSKVIEISSITKFTRFLFPHFRVTRAEIIRNVCFPLSAVRCCCVHLSLSLLASKNYKISSLLHIRIGKFLVVI